MKEEVDTGVDEQLVSFINSEIVFLGFLLYRQRQL